MKKIKVLIVDDSAMIRELLTKILEQDSQIEVVGSAVDPFDAREKIKRLTPDVLTLDIEMPRMDGITFLKNLMRLRPMPVVMISSLTERGADVTLKALELGAVDYIAKPKVDVKSGLERYQRIIIEKIKTAGQINPAKLERRPIGLPTVPPKLGIDAIIGSSPGKPRGFSSEKVIAIGASTGGTEAIRQVLSSLPAEMPGIVITQHIPATFSGPFARRVDSESALKVSEAKDGEIIKRGHAYIAPGDRHLLVEKQGGSLICRLNDGPAVNRHRPSVDVLFRSMAQNCGRNAIGAILTGMGDDGAQGLLEMKEAGAITIAQDEKSSVVWGMPGAAVKLNAAKDILAISQIAPQLIRSL